MANMRRIRRTACAVLLATFCLLLADRVHAGNEVMGELIFEGKSKVEKTSGVWVDGQYVGYLKELKGSKKVLLLPGEHTVAVKQDGYRDFVQKVNLQPGEKVVVNVAMEKGPTGTMPAVTSTVKISVNPSRAAVFLDGLFVGHVGEFDGAGQGLLVAPGRHKIKIALPGYQTFETEITPLPNQKVEVKTDLVKGESIGNEPLMDRNGNERVPPPEPATGPQR
jgi:hypothetical protein